MRAFFLPGALAVLLGSVAGSQAAIAKSSTRIAYSADGMIRVLEPDGSRSRVLARGESPSWNPEGTAIAFHSARVPGNGLDIYTMDADGTDQRRIVMHPGGGGEHPINTADDYGPAWSPTGWTIAFTTRRDGNEEIYSMDPIGHRVQRLTDSPAADREPAWSPDGSVIAFVSDRDGNDEIYSLDGRRNLRRLTQAAGADRAPAWSPDGRRIVFQSLRDGNWELYSLDADGSEPRRLTQSPTAETNPSWSRDGGTIVFTADDAAGRYLAAIAAAGGPARRLTAPSRSADHADWQPAADLALAIRHARFVGAGRLVPLRLTVRNLIRMPAYQVVVAGSLPAHARVVGVRASAGACSRRPARFRCSLSGVGPSAAAWVEATVRPRRCGRLSLRGSVSSVQGDLTPANNERRSTLRVSC